MDVESGDSALHMACSENDNQALDLLLAKTGIDVNVRNNYRRTPLFSACDANNEQAVTKLLSIPGIDVNAGRDNAFAPLHVACSKQRHAIVTKLLACPGIDVNARDLRGNTALGWACWKNNIQIVTSLLASPNSQPMLLMDLCSQAVRRIMGTMMDGKSLAKLNLPKTLIKYLDLKDKHMASPNIDVNTNAIFGSTPLGYACSRGSHEIISKLLSYPGIDVNIRDSRGITALSTACLNNRQQVVAVLLDDPRIDVNAKSNITGFPSGRRVGGVTSWTSLYDWTPLHTACWKLDYDIVAQLLACPRVDVNAQDNDGNTALHRACVDDRYQIVTTLLACPRIDVNVKSSDGSTALLEAFNWNHPKIMEKLLAYPGVDVNARNNAGDNLIILAAKYCDMKVLKLLIYHPEVDFEAKGEDGLGLDMVVGSKKDMTKKMEEKDEEEIIKGKCLTMIKKERINRQIKRAKRGGCTEQHIQKLDKEIQEEEGKQKAGCPTRSGFPDPVRIRNFWSFEVRIRSGLCTESPDLTKISFPNAYETNLD